MSKDRTKVPSLREQKLIMDREERQTLKAELAEVREMRKEARHLASTLSRLETLIHGQIRTPENTLMNQDQLIAIGRVVETPLKGWMLSLLESYIALVYYEYENVGAEGQVNQFLYGLTTFGKKEVGKLRQQTLAKRSGSGSSAGTK